MTDSSCCHLLLLPLVTLLAELQQLAAARQKEAGRASPSYVNKTLSVPADPVAQGFVILTQVVHQCVAHSCWREPSKHLTRQDPYAACLNSLQDSNQRRCDSRQQQLLQAVAWRLPLLLMREAVRLGGREPLVTEVAAEAAWVCCTAWHMPGLHPAAAAAAAGAASGAAGGRGPAPLALSPAEAALWDQFCSSFSEPFLTAVLPGLLDAWLQLMQQQSVGAAWQPGCSTTAQAVRAAASNSRVEPTCLSVWMLWLRCCPCCSRWLML